MHVLMLCPDCYMIDPRVLRQARTLREAGHQVTLLSGFECAEDSSFIQDGIDIHRYHFNHTDPRWHPILRLPIPQAAKRATTRAIHIAGKLLAQPTAFDFFVRSKARRFRADVVHVHDLPLLGNGMALAKEWDAPLVFDAHEIYYEEDNIPGPYRMVLERTERKAVPKMDLFITVNEFIADYYEKKYGVRPLVLYNAPRRPPEGFDARSRALLRHKAGLGTEAKVVLFQGWYSHERNLERLIRAVNYFPEDAHLALIGYGEYEDDLKQLAAAQPAGDRVHFLGRVEFSEMLELTAGADVGVIPYLPTCLNSILCSPNKFFEFTNAGLPFVAHSMPFIEKVGAGRGIALTGDLTSPEGFALPIVTLLKDDALRARMHDNCLKARQDLCWQAEGERLLKAYRPILAKVNGRI